MKGGLWLETNLHHSQLPESKFVQFIVISHGHEGRNHPICKYNASRARTQSFLGYNLQAMF